MTEYLVAHPTNPNSGQASELFAGRYRKVEMLGAGGMGTVWLAEKSGPGNFTQRVVIKQIHEHMAQQPEFVTRFEDEARLAGLLHHPNIVRVEDFGSADGVLYLVMEHVQGAELQELVQSMGQLPLRVVLAMAVDIANALAYAHDLKDYDGKALKVVHRDVSPQNIMITRTGDAKLLDFGIARATSNQVETSIGVVKGKLGYLSPEQVEGRPLDGRSDQFTLGIVLYELLCGGRLFDGKSDLGILTRIQKADVPHLGRLATDLPDGLTAIVMRCLHRSPNARFDDCTQLAKALGNTLRHVGGRLATEEFEAWWQQGRIVGDPHTNRDIPPLGTQKLVDEVFGQVGPGETASPEDQTRVAQASSFGIAERAPEEATVIASTGDLAEPQALAGDDATVITNPGELQSRSVEEPTRVTGVPSPSPRPVQPARSPSSEHRAVEDAPAPGPEQENQMLGGPLVTVILLLFALVAGVVWFQSMGGDGNPGEALVQQGRAP